MKTNKLRSLLLALLLLTGMLAGCAAQSKNESADYAVEYNGEMGEAVYDNAKGEVVESVFSDSGTLSDRRLIKTVDLDAETEDLDTLLSQLQAKVNQLGGYVENQRVYNGSAYSSRRSRDASMTIRIPAEKLDEFLNHVTGTSNIISHTSDIDDVTLTYVATESRVKALQAEEERLLELMEKAQTMSDLLEIEARLTEVRYELESVTSQLNVLENQVSYSTVDLYVSEVQQYTPVEEETLWQRISGGFVESLKNIGNGVLEVLVFLFVKLPYFMVLAVVAVVIVLVIKSSRKKTKKQPEEGSQG